MNNKQIAIQLVRLAKALAAGCEKLPEGPMRDNCEKKKEEGKGKKESYDRKAGFISRETLTYPQEILDAITEAIKYEDPSDFEDILRDLGHFEKAIKRVENDVNRMSVGGWKLPAQLSRDIKELREYIKEVIDDEDTSTYGDDAVNAAESLVYETKKLEDLLSDSNAW